MDDKMLEKRLELLNKSYKKIPPHTRTNDIIKAIKEEQFQNRKRFHIHWPYVASFIGVLLISSVLVLQFTMEKTESRKHKEQISNLSQSGGEMDDELLKEIQDAKSLYELRKTQAKEQLGFSETTFNRTQMGADAKGQLTYIESIQARDLPLDTKFKWIQRGKRILESDLKTPRMMMSDLNHSLTDEEAEIWVENFIRTEKDILPLYEEVLEENKQYWKPLIENGTLNMKKFNQDENTPPSLVKLKDGIFNNVVKLSYNQEKDQLETSLDFEFFSILNKSESLPIAYNIYLKTQFTPVIRAGQFTVSWKQAADRLMEYEMILKKLPDHSRFRNEIKNEYELLYQFFVVGGVNQPIFTKSKQLKPMVQDAFQYILTTYPDYQTAESIQKVSNELKESNFVKPDNWKPRPPVILSSEVQKLYEDQ